MKYLFALFALIPVSFTQAQNLGNKSAFSVTPETGDVDVYGNGGATVATGVGAALAFTIHDYFVSWDSALQLKGRDLWIVAAIVGGGVVGLKCAAYPQAAGSTFGQRWMNCLAEPLRFFNVNPRDRLKLRNVLACEPNRIAVRVTSASGRVEERSFVTEGDVLKSVTLSESVGRSGAAPVQATFLASPTGQSLVSGYTEQAGADQTVLTRDQVAATGGLLNDFKLYQGMCQDAEFSAKQVAPHAFDRTTPSEFRRYSR